MDRSNLDGSTASLDITQEACPMTYVRTKLRLEALPAGAILEIRLRGEEAVRNVPRSAVEEGHEILLLEPESVGNESGVWKLHIKKTIHEGA